MAEIASAFVSIVPSARGFGSKMESQVGGEIEDSGNKVGSKFGTAMKVGALAAFGAAVAGAKFLGDAIGEAQEAEKITARTENVIKKMGNASNISAGQVAELASSLSLKTGIDDEAIQSGQNLLLTFGNVRNEVGKGNDIFNQASSLMVDMSAAMGTDAKGSAIQLGKALNDPIKGLSSLSRVGVSFTEQQKAQITALTESGDVMGAQKIILGELERQFGGAGAAMSTPAEKAKVAFGNLKEQIGTALLPAVNGLINLFIKAMPTVSAAIAGIGPAFTAVGSFLRPLVGKIRDFFSLFGEGSDGSKRVGQLQDTVMSVFGAIKGIVTSFVSIVSTLWQAFGSDILSYARITFGNMQTIIKGAFNVIEGIFELVSAALKGDWSGMWDAIKKIVDGVWDVIKGIVRQGWAFVGTIFSIAGDALKGAFRLIWDGIKQVASNAWDGIKNTVSDGATGLVDAVKAVPGRIVNAAGGLFANAGSSLINMFINAMKGAGDLAAGVANNIWGAVRGLLNDAITKINAALEFTINLPGPNNLTINPPDIPALAKGGVLTGPTLFLGGEGGESEAVLPLSKLTAMLDRERAAGRGDGGPGGGNSGATYQFYTFDLDNAVREAQRREAFAGTS